MDGSGNSEAVVRLAGDVDVAMAPALRYEITEAIESQPPGGRVVVDLAQVEFVDSMTLGTLAELKARAEHEGIAFVLAAPSPRVVRILHIAGLAGLFGVDG